MTSRRSRALDRSARTRRSPPPWSAAASMGRRRSGSSRKPRRCGTDTARPATADRARPAAAGPFSQLGRPLRVEPRDTLPGRRFRRVPNTRRVIGTNSATLVVCAAKIRSRRSPGSPSRKPGTVQAKAPKPVENAMLPKVRSAVSPRGANLSAGEASGPGASAGGPEPLAPPVPARGGAVSDGAGVGAGEVEGGEGGPELGADVGAEDALGIDPTVGLGVGGVNPQSAV